MRIAEISKKYGLSADTLRYYERIGLLSGIARSASGIRDYSESDCRRIEFVKCMRACGIPIEALVEYMNLLDQGDKTIPQRKALLEKQRNLMKARIKTLQDGLDQLNHKIENYDTLMKGCERSL